MNPLFAELFTITVLSYWAGCAAYRFGQWLGWVTDPDQWPRGMAVLLLDWFRWDRKLHYAVVGLDPLTEEAIEAIRRAPRGTP